MPHRLSLGVALLMTVPAVAELPPGAVGRLGDPAFRAAGTAFALSPDGTTVALADNSSGIRLVDAETWAARGTLPFPPLPETIRGQPVSPNVPRTVTLLRFSADGRLLADLRDYVERTVVWDVRTGRVEHTSSEEQRNPYPSSSGLSADLSRRAKYGPVPHKDPERPSYGIRIDDPRTGERVTAVAVTRNLAQDRVERIVLSPDGKRVAGWNPSDTGPSGLPPGFPPPPGIPGGPPPPAGGRPDSLAERPVVTVWDTTTGKELGRVPARGRVADVVFSPAGIRLAVQYGSEDERGVWDLTAGKWLCKFTTRDWSGPTVFLGNDAVGVVSRGGAFQRREVATGNLLDFIPGPVDDGFRLIPEVAVRLDSSVRVCGRVGAAFIVWDVAPGGTKPARVFGGTAGPLGPPQAMAFTPDGRTLRALTEDGAVHTWDVPARRLTGRLRLRPPLDTELPERAPVRLSADARFALVTLFRSCRVWDLDRGLVVGNVSDERPQHTVDADGRIVGAGLDPLAALDGLPTDGQVARRAKGVSDDGRWGAVVSSRRDPGGAAETDLVVYDLATRKAEQTIRLPREVFLSNDSRPTFSPDGRCLLLKSERGGTGSWVWEWRTGRVLVRNWNVRIAFSPDGRLIGLGSVYYPGPQPMPVLEIASGSPRYTFPAGPGAVVFAPDGRTFVAPAPDASLLIWDLMPKAAAKPLTPADRDALWAGLADPDAAKAFAHMARLVAVPADAVPLIRDRIRPADPAAEVARLIRQLDADDLATREAAARELPQWGDAATAAARKALEANPSPEARRRLEFFLEDGKEQAHRTTLRPVRAVEVLERIGTPAAVEVLRGLAAGPADVTATEAKGALGRLK